MSTRRFVVRASPYEAGIAALFIVLLLAMRLYQGWEAYERADGDTWLAVIHLAEAVLLGLALIGTLTFLFTRRPIVTVGPEGISAAAHSGETIPWGAFESGWVENEKTLCLRLRDPARYPRRWWWRGWQRKPDRAHIAIRLTHAQDKFDDLVDAVDRFAPRLLGA